MPLYSLLYTDGGAARRAARIQADGYDDGARMADGKAEGKLKIGGEELSYSVSKDAAGGYSISVE